MEDAKSPSGDLMGYQPLDSSETAKNLNQQPVHGGKGGLNHSMANQNKQWMNGIDPNPPSLKSRGD